MLQLFNTQTMMLGSVDMLRSVSCVEVQIGIIQYCVMHIIKLDLVDMGIVQR